VPLGGQNWLDALMQINLQTGARSKKTRHGEDSMSELACHAFFRMQPCNPLYESIMKAVRECV